MPSFNGKKRKHGYLESKFKNYTQEGRDFCCVSVACCKKKKKNEQTFANFVPQISFKNSSELPLFCKLDDFGGKIKTCSAASWCSHALRPLPVATSDQ